VAKIFSRVKESRYCNSSDTEIVEALERLFIFDSEITGDFEEDETHRHALGILRLMLGVVVMFSIKRILPFTDESFSVTRSVITSMFFGLLFLMLHLETNNPSRILLILTCLSLCFSLW